MMSPVAPLRCLIVDDSPYFLDATRNLLEQQGIAVVGVASAVAEGLRRAAGLRPDVILVDIDLGTESGFDLAEGFQRQSPAPPVIMISAHAQQDFADLIADSPAIGFLSKSEVSSSAIRSLLRPRNEDQVTAIRGR